MARHGSPGEDSGIGEIKHKYLSKRYWKDNSTPMGASNAKAKEYNDVINLSLGDPDIFTDRMII